MKSSAKKTVTAKLFKNGNSQAIRLPKEFRFEGDEVLSHREGRKIVVEEKSETKNRKAFWDDFFYNTPLVSPDFLSDRNDTPPQVRDLF